MVLNLFRLADHLTNFVSVRGPPNKFPHFLRNFLVISPKFCLGSQHHTKISTFSREKFWRPFLKSFPKFLAFFRDKHRTKITISIWSLVSDSHQKVSKFPTLVAARHADVRSPPVGRGPQVENCCSRLPASNNSTYWFLHICYKYFWSWWAPIGLGGPLRPLDKTALGINKIEINQ